MYRQHIPKALAPVLMQNAVRKPIATKYMDVRTVHCTSVCTMVLVMYAYECQLGVRKRQNVYRFWACSDCAGPV